MFDLTNKQVLITGSTDGLGKLTAQHLANQGAHIIIHGRSQTKADQAVAELPGNGHGTFICDLSNPQDVINACRQFSQPVDILINNAGIWQEGDTVEISPERMVEMVNVNLAAVLLITRHLLPTLQKSEFAQVLNVISVAGYEIPFDYYHTTYTATKFALQGLSEALAKEFEGKNIRVMGFYPGGMDTKFFEKAGEEYDAKEPWMFDPQESVDAIQFMLTRNPKVSVKRLDLINHLFE